MSQSESSRKYYRKNWAKRRAEIKARLNSVLAFVKKYKAEHPCIRCGESEPCCLDFHHVDPNTKSGHVTNLVRSGWSIARIQTEIDKCVMLCANCHQKEHFMGL